MKAVVGDATPSSVTTTGWSPSGMESGTRRLTMQAGELSDAGVKDVGWREWNAGAVESNVIGMVQSGRRSRAAVAVEGRFARTRESADNAAEVHLTDAIISPIDDLIVARAIRRYRTGIAQRDHICRVAVHNPVGTGYSRDGIELAMGGDGQAY